MRKYLGFLGGADSLTVAEKVNSIAGFLAIVTTFLLLISIQTVRLQNAYIEMHASWTAAAVNTGRVNALIYAIVMDSRGVYMSTERAAAGQFAAELLKHNGELADVVNGWERTADPGDLEQFTAFKQRVKQFIDFHQELARRAIEIGAAAAREWGSNEANRRSLNSDLEALQRSYDERAREANELADRNRYAAWYLFMLGLAALVLAALNVVVMRSSVLRPLADITKATDRIAAGDLHSAVPHLRRYDEIGRVARAVQKFRNAVEQVFELEEVGFNVSQQRDAAMAERDKFSDKYRATRWQLSAAINSMPQGLLMLDGKANVLAINGNYRQMYNLPETIKPGSSVQDIMQFADESGVFRHGVQNHLRLMLDRMAARKPVSYEIVLSDGRTMKIDERPMDGGGWVSVQEDMTEQRKKERILERTERLLATIIENVREGIIAKDARSMRYLFVNKAAERTIGLSRAELIGKTARELFPAESADLIERRDRQLLAQQQQLEPIVDTINSPVRGPGVISWRRLQVGGTREESHVLVTMVEDLTDAMGDAA